MEASRKISYAQEAAVNNLILNGWNQKWGIRVYPWYSNDKLKFSFIEKGSSGKGNSFDVYVDTYKPDIMGQCMDTWAYDILDGSFVPILKAEKAAGEKFPKYYKISTGENGEKYVGIMASDTPGSYVLSGKGSDKKYCAIRITHAALKLFARRYLSSYESRRNQLEQMRVDAEMHSKYHAEPEDEAYVPQAEEPLQQDVSSEESCTEVKCVLKGDVITKKGMKIVAMYDPYSDAKFGTLYIKSGNPMMNAVIQIPVQKKGNDYLLLSK